MRLAGSLRATRPRPSGPAARLIEAVEAALKDQGYKKIADFLTARTDRKRGQEYGSIVSSLKQLAAMTHHHYGRESTFTPPYSRAVWKRGDVRRQVL